MSQNLYVKKPHYVERIRKQPTESRARERLILRMVRLTSEVSGPEFSSLIRSVEKRMLRAQRGEGKEIMESTIMKPESAIAASCRTELKQLSDLFDRIEVVRAVNIKELRASGRLKKEEYSTFMDDQAILREWFMQQEQRLIDDFSDQLSRFGNYEIDNKYASYRILKMMMWDVDDTLTPTNVPSMFDGMLEQLQRKCDEGFIPSTATGKPVKYVMELFDDPYGAGQLIERVKEAIDNGVTAEDISEIKKMISQGRAGLLSDLRTLDECSGDMKAFLGILEQRRESEWLPTDIHMICEAGCHVRMPDGQEFITIVDGGSIEFIPFDSSQSDRAAKALRILSDIRNHLNSTFNHNGITFVNATVEGIEISRHNSVNELPQGLPERVGELVANKNEYFEVLSRGGKLYGELIEPRGETELLQDLKANSTDSTGVVVIVDQTYSVASEILSRAGELGELKTLILKGRIGVVSDISLIEAYENSGDISGLMSIFQEREVMVLPKPAESFYSRNEIMFCPRPSTYADGDRITTTEQFMVNALNTAATSFIQSSGAELDCVAANHGLDITPKGISKPIALEALNRTLQGHKLVIYAGDSGNDVGIMGLKNNHQFSESTNSTVIPVAVFFKEQESKGARKVSPEVIKISDAAVRSLGDIDKYQQLVQDKIEGLRANHEPVRKVH